MELNAATALGAFLAVVGLSHFVATNYFLTLVPPWLPAARALVLVSGGVEVIIGTGLLWEPTRPASAWSAAALIAVYLLTHVDALWRSSSQHARWLSRPAGAAARVAVNAGYLLWALYVAAAA